MIERYRLKEMGDIWEDGNRFRIFLEIEVLVCEALMRSGRISPSDLKKIKAFKNRGRINIGKIRAIEKDTKHETVAFLEYLAGEIGIASRYLHFGMTSSDILDTCLSLQICRSLKLIRRDLEGLASVLSQKAEAYKDVIMAGRTHGMHAEPITFGFKLAIWYCEVLRHIARADEIFKRVNVGKISGPVGTYSNIDPGIEKFVMKKMGLRPAPVSSQIIQRDRYAEYMLFLSLVASSLEKFALEIRNLQRTEVGELEEPFEEKQKGSSAMPHKHNPVISERICGLSRIVRANASVSLQNIPLWHERDISHSSSERIIIPDSSILTDYMITKFIYLLSHMKVFRDRMLVNLGLTGGMIFSQKILLTLVAAGMSRSAAHRHIQAITSRVLKSGQTFSDLVTRDRTIRRYISPAELKSCFDIKVYTKNIGKTVERVLCQRWS